MTNSMLPPKATINGTPVSATYGTQAIPVWPGQMRLDISCQWLRTYGQASLDLNLAPGQVVDVYYAPPFHQFASGNIGFTKQKHKGVGFWIAFGIVFGLLMVLVVVSMVLSVA